MRLYEIQPLRLPPLGQRTTGAGLGSVAAYERRETVTFSPREQTIEYRVQRGDTLFRISRRFKNCGVEGPNQIMLYNGLNSTVIRPGQKLLIPCAD